MRSSGRPHDPLVSIGMPVRDGAKTLVRAIDSVVNQSYRKLEIIISDNCSADETEDICRKAMARDERIRYFRQEKTLTALQNFRFVFERSRGRYFLWAAHDDWRTPNYVEVLLEGFLRVPAASIAFTDAVSCPDISLNNCGQAEPYFCECDTTGLSFWRKLKKQSQRGCVLVYGLINQRYLSEYPWYELDCSPDRPLLFALLARGDFIYVPGATFAYHNPSKSLEQSAREIIFRELMPYARERVAWASATAVQHAEARNGRYRNRLLLFLLLYVWHNRGIKNTVYSWMPNPLRSAWRRARRLAAWAGLAQDRPMP